jgi:hypothetical protein
MKTFKTRNGMYKILLLFLLFALLYFNVKGKQVCFGSADTHIINVLQNNITTNITRRETIVLNEDPNSNNINGFILKRDLDFFNVKDGRIGGLNSEKIKVYNLKEAIEGDFLLETEDTALKSFYEKIKKDSISQRLPNPWTPGFCNVVPIASSSFLVNGNTYTPCTPSVNCAASNASVTLEMLVAVQPNQFFCAFMDNQSSWNDGPHTIPQNEFALSVNIIGITIEYPLLNNYTMAYDIEPVPNCLCHCPDSPLTTKCDSGFNFCGTNTDCFNFYTEAKTDCFENKLEGSFSDNDRGCCTWDLSNHQHAQVAQIGPPLISVANISYQLYERLPGGAVNVVSSFFANGLTLFPPGQAVINISGPSYFPSFLFQYIGSFAGNFYQGGDFVVFLPGNNFKIITSDLINTLNTYDVTKCGAIKYGYQNSQLQDIFDSVAIRNSVKVQIDSCVDDKFTLTSDLNPCQSSTFLNLTQYLSQFGTNIQVDPAGGILSFSPIVQPNQLLTVQSNFTPVIVATTPQVYSFNCSATPGYQISVLQCNVSSSPGATYAIVSFYSAAWALLYQTSQVLGGSGTDNITFNIPATQFADSGAICMNGAANQAKCRNLTVVGKMIVVGTANWVYNVTGNITASSSTHSISFNFWDPSTWLDNLWQTILVFFAWFVLALILIAMAVALIMVIFYLPSIYNWIDTMRSNRNKKRRMKKKERETGQKSLLPTEEY